MKKSTLARTTLEIDHIMTATDYDRTKGNKLSML